MYRGERDEYKSSSLVNAIIVGLFLPFAISNLYLGVTGISWNIIGTAETQFYLILNVVISSTITGAIFINLMFYSRLSGIRRFILLLLAMDMGLINVLYLITHPTSALWAPLLADRMRNRTLVAVASTAVMSSMLLFSVVKEDRLTRENIIKYGFIGGLVIPVLGLACVLSPEPLMILTTEEGGLTGLTPIGIVLSVAMPSIGVGTLYRCIREYRQYRDEIVFALVFSLIMWLMASIYMTSLWDPHQIAELLYMTDVTVGMAMISIALATNTLLGHVRRLLQEVRERGRELIISRQESEMFLSAWAHKMGNLLQGITTYLELLSECKAESEMTTLRNEAQILTYEANRLNRQVSWLWTVKSAMDEPLHRADMTDVLTKAVNRIQDLFGDVSILLKSCPEPVVILVDDNVDLLFVGLISYILRAGGIESTKITLSCSISKDSVSTSIQLKGPHTSYELIKELQSADIRDVNKIDLDLYTSRLLLQRYNAVAEIDIEDDSIVHLRFPRVDQ